MINNNNFNFTTELTGAQLIGSRENYNEKREEFGVCENVLHSRRPRDVPAIYESEDTWNT